MAGDNLNEATIKALPTPARGNRVHYFAGATLQGSQAPRGFGVRVTAGGAKAFVLNYRLRGREYRYTIGQYPDWSALGAMREARELRQRIDRGENPLEDRAPPPALEAPKTVADVLDEFVRRYVNAASGPLRTAGSVESALRRLVKPVIGQLGIYELRRSQIAEMLDRIEDENGPVQADRVLAYVRKGFNWYATRDDDFTPPIIRGMARTRSAERARERVLSDDEIRLIWPALTEAGTFGALVKMLLLTAQRRREVAHLRRREVKEGVWVIPAERYKTKRPQVVPLSAAALAVMADQPTTHDLVFPSIIGTPFSGYDKPKKALDAAVAKAKGGEPMPNWTLHDLRRTAKTLMARAGVRPDISERVLGHVIAGVEGVYDRHSYLDEKRDALEKLAAMIERILSPTPENVVPLRQEAR
jgi:integrase